MCMASKPSFEKAPEYSKPLEPDNSALDDEAKRKAAMAGGGTQRSTMLTSLRGTLPPIRLGSATTRTPGSSALG